MSEVKKYLSRIFTLDLMRGYFLIVMLLDHLFYYPSGLDILTGRGSLFVSSAEGFFLVSGIVLGIVRGRKLIDKPIRIATKLLLQRSLQLYIAYVILTVLFTLIAWMFVSSQWVKPTPAPLGTPLLELIWQTLTFHYLYGWTDYLRLYIIFLVASPLAIWLLRRGWWYIVLAASWIVWWLYPHFSHDYWGSPISWQLVFFSGMVIGFHWPELAARWQKIPKAIAHRIGLITLTAALLTMAASMYIVFSAQPPSATTAITQLHESLLPYFNKDRLPLARLALGALWFWGLFWIIRRYEPWIMKKIGPFLIPLGTNSLYVYIIQGFIVYGAHLLWPPSYVASAAWYQHLLLSLAAIFLVWIAVKREFLFKIIPR